MVDALASNLVQEYFDWEISGDQLNYGFFADMYLQHLQL